MTPSAVSTPSPEAESLFTATGGLYVWSLRALIAVAAGISIYLSWVSWTNATPFGCGDAALFDCESVMTSGWSTLLGLPLRPVAVTAMH